MGLPFLKQKSTAVILFDYPEFWKKRWSRERYFVLEKHFEFYCNCCAEVQNIRRCRNCRICYLSELANLITTIFVDNCLQIQILFLKKISRRNIPNITAALKPNLWKNDFYYPLNGINEVLIWNTIRSFSGEVLRNQVRKSSNIELIGVGFILISFNSPSLTNGRMR